MSCRNQIRELDNLNRHYSQMKDRCTEIETKSKSSSYELEKTKNDLNEMRDELAKKQQKIDFISTTLNQANASSQLTKQQLNDALIIVAKYNELYPRYAQLVKDYETMQKSYNNNNKELDETKYLLNLNSETMNLVNDIDNHNNFQNTLDKTVIQEHFIESWRTGENTSLPSKGETYSENTSTTYKNIKQQNEILKNQIDKITNIYSADNQRVIYQTTNLDSQNSIYSYLFIAYYILLLGLIILFYFDIKNVSRNVKMGVVIAIGIFTWVIYPFEKIVYFIFSYLFSIVNGSVFFNDY